MMNGLVNLTLAVKLLATYYKYREDVEKYRVEDFRGFNPSITIISETKNNKTKTIEVIMDIKDGFQLKTKKGKDLLANISDIEKKEYDEIIKNYTW